MTRKEEIIRTARRKEKEVGFSQFVHEAKGVNSAYGIGFLEGAEWADNHPILEVKEVDLEKELDVIIDSLNNDKYEHLSIRQQLSHIARHFYELGLKTQKGE